MHIILLNKIIKLMYLPLLILNNIYTFINFKQLIYLLNIHI